MAAVSILIAKPMHINANMHKHTHAHSVQTAYPPAGHLLVSHQLVSPAPGQGGHLPHLTLPHRPPPHCVAETEEHFVSKSYSVFERSNFKDNAQTTFRRWMFLLEVLVSGTSSELKHTRFPFYFPASRCLDRQIQKAWINWRVAGCLAAVLYDTNHECRSGKLGICLTENLDEI